MGEKTRNVICDNYNLNLYQKHENVMENEEKLVCLN